MYFNQIEAFVNVVKYKSFSKAAKAMFISQPSVSTYIKSLETELGVQLLSRQSKDVIPTDAGITLYDYAVELLHLCDITKIAMQNYSADIRGSITISADYFSSQHVLPELLGGFYTTHPNITCNVFLAEDALTIENIESFKADIGISENPCESDKLNCTLLYKDPIVLITPNTENFQNINGDFPISKLLQEPFIFHSGKSTSQAAVMKFLDTFGLQKKDLNISMSLPSAQSIKQAVRYGNGISFISRKAAEDYVDFGYIKAFEFNSTLLFKKIYLLSHKDSWRSPLASMLLKHIHTFYNIPEENLDGPLFPLHP